MNYSITKDSGVPAYIQLYNYLVQDIVAGIYPLDSRLPSKRIIAEETGVSLITVEHTMNLLSDEGYIETRQRSGYFVIYYYLCRMYIRYESRLSRSSRL